MGRIADVINTVKELKELLPVIMEIIECFRSMSVKEQQRILEIAAPRVGKKGTEALTVILGINEHHDIQQLLAGLPEDKREG